MSNSTTQEPGLTKGWQSRLADAIADYAAQCGLVGEPLREFERLVSGFLAGLFPEGAADLAVDIALRLKRWLQPDELRRLRAAMEVEADAGSFAAWVDAYATLPNDDRAILVEAIKAGDVQLRVVHPDAETADVVAHDREAERPKVTLEATVDPDRCVWSGVSCRGKYDVNDERTEIVEVALRSQSESIGYEGNCDTFADGAVRIVGRVGAGDRIADVILGTMAIEARDWADSLLKETRKSA